MTLQTVEGEANVRKSSGEERLKLDTRSCIGVCTHAYRQSDKLFTGHSSVL